MHHTTELRNSQSFLENVLPRLAYSKESWSQAERILDPIHAVNYLAIVSMSLTIHASASHVSCIHSLCAVKIIAMAMI